MLRCQTYLYIWFVQIFLENYRLSLAHKCQNHFYVWDLENYSVDHKQCLSNCAEISRGTEVSGGANIPRTSTYWFPTCFFRKRNTVSALEVPNHYCVWSWILNTFTQAVVLKSFQKFQGITNISVRELIF